MRESHPCLCKENYKTGLHVLGLVLLYRMANKLTMTQLGNAQHLELVFKVAVVGIHPRKKVNIHQILTAKVCDILA